MFPNRLSLFPILSFSAALLAGTNAAPAMELQTVWEATGLARPECAVYDSVRDVMYVSCMGDTAAGHDKKDGNGSIARLSMEGEVLQASWCGGLNDPKGMVLANGYLYVTDLDELVAIEPATGRIARKYRCGNPRGSLNGATADGYGNVFVCDADALVVYRLVRGVMEIWYASTRAELGRPTACMPWATGCWSGERPSIAKARRSRDRSGTSALRIRSWARFLAAPPSATSTASRRMAREAGLSPNGLPAR